MADTKISALAELTALAAADEFVVVDKSDTSMAGTGTDKRTKYGTLWPGRYFNAESPVYGAVPDDYYADGTITASSTTFTSPTANFTVADEGKQIVVEKGKTSEQAFHTTIATGGFVNSTTVTLTNAGLRTVTGNARFYISRGGDQNAHVQAAIDACAASGGGTVKCPGVGYLVTGLVNKNRVRIKGASMRGTLFHLANNSNPIAIIRNDYTTNNSATTCSVIDCTLDGNAQRNSSHYATTLGAALSAGAGSLTVATGQGANILAACGPAGTAVVTGGPSAIGSYRIRYTQITGDVLTIESGVEYTDDTGGASNGAAITFIRNHGILMVPQPIVAAGTYTEHFDPHHTFRDVYVRQCKGDGFSCWGQSDILMDRCWVQACEGIGIRPSHDTTLSNCTSHANGRMGYYMRGSSGQGTNLKAFVNGTIEPNKGFGFMFEGPVSLEEGCQAYAGLNAQDNYADGFMFKTAQRRMVQGTSSSNGVAAGLNNPVNLGIITMTIASPAVFTQTGHGFKTGDQFMMQTTGALPTGLTALTPYYVTTVLTSSTFRASATPGGTDIVTTGSQSGVHTLAGGSYCGIQIDGATGCFIDIACTERKQYDTVNAYQMNAIGISSVGSVTTQNNIIRISHAGSGALAANALGPPILPGSTIDGSNSLEINGTEWPTKRSDQTVAGTTLTDETDMQIYLTAGTKYRITGKIFFNCVAANGLKYGFTGPAVTSTRWERVDNATTQNAPAARVLDTVIPGSTSLTGTGTTGIISIDAVIVPSASGMLKFQFAEVANSTGAVVLAGSYLNAQGVY